jgi:lipoic acid synthetase
VETVPRLYETVRPGADYERSLEVLRLAREPMDGTDTTPRTKSGLMLGLGESAEEVKEVLADLRRVGCDALTIGQYLAPSKEHLPVQRFVPPEEFETWRRRALRLGFVQVTSGPMVRSSYNARAIP